MREVASLERAVTAAEEAIELAFRDVQDLEKALARSATDPGTFDTELETIKQSLYDVDEALSGNRSRRAFGEPRVPNVARRLQVASISDGQSDYGPTATHRRQLEIARQEFARIEPELRKLLEVDLVALKARMEEAGVPWTAGRPLPEAR